MSCSCCSFLFSRSSSSFSGVEALLPGEDSLLAVLEVSEEVLEAALVEALAGAADLAAGASAEDHPEEAAPAADRHKN